MTLTDYKEIPIDDSKGVEQFKVGDRVRIYGQINDDSGEKVTGIKEGYLLQFTEMQYAH